MMKKNITMIFVAMFALALIAMPLVSSYASGPFTQMINLWDLFVEQMFGSFWAAVIFLMIIFMILLALGGISLYTNIIFNLYFILAMAIGYGYPLFVFPLILGAFLYFMFQAIKLFMENR
jgi:hypothetical protein